MKVKHSASQLLASDFQYVDKIIKNNYLSPGLLSNQLKKKLTKISKKKYVFLTNSGSSALFLCLETLKKKFPKKKKIIIPRYSCTAILNVILESNLKPIFAELEDDNLNINFFSVKKLISNKILAILAVSIGGVTVDQRIFGIKNIPVINDCCQGLGSKLNNKNYISFGDFTILSFGPTKIISGGMGGAILTNSKTNSISVGNLMNFEKDKSFYYRNGFMSAYNYNLSDLNAGLILSQLNRLNYIINKRKIIAKKYDKILTNNSFRILKEKKNESWNRYRYYCLDKKNFNLYKKLRKSGIDARIDLGHNLDAYFNRKKNSIKNILSIPIHHNFKKEQIERIKKIIDGF
jgi:perosamine synthetase